MNEEHLKYSDEHNGVNSGETNGIIERYVSFARDDDDDDDNEEEDDHNDDKLETWQPVDKDDSHNDHTDNDHCDCDNLAEDNHEMMTTRKLSTKK